MTRWQLIVPMLLTLVWAPTAQAQDARDRPPPAAELSAGYAGFVDEGLIAHGVLAGALRWPLSPRVSVGPELVYMRGPGGDRDFFATGNLTFDFLTPSPTRAATPYVVAGAGLMRHTGEVGVGTFTSNEGAFTAGLGVRARLSGRSYLGAEWRVGWELHTRLTAIVGFNLE
jgi:hypothetical protein